MHSLTQDLSYVLLIILYCLGSEVSQSVHRWYEGAGMNDAVTKREFRLADSFIARTGAEMWTEVGSVIEDAILTGNLS